MERAFGLGGFLAASSDFGLEDWVSPLVPMARLQGKRDYPDYASSLHAHEYGPFAGLQRLCILPAGGGGGGDFSVGVNTVG